MSARQPRFEIVRTDAGWHCWLDPHSGQVEYRKARVATMTAPIGGAAATRQLAILESLLTGSTHGDEAGDGPPEPVVAEADQDWLADREERRSERALWGGAA